MAITPSSLIRNVKYINLKEKTRIKDFLHGAVYSICNNNENAWFSVRDIVGKKNFEWQDTPLVVLYDKHRNKGKNHSQAIKSAGKDCGWLLKSVLHADKRLFETKKEELVRKYKWKKEM